MNKKYTIFFIILFFVSIFLFNQNHLLYPKLNRTYVSYSFLIGIFLIFFGMIFFTSKKIRKNIAPFLQHNIIQALREKEYSFIWKNFIFSMIFEEVLFRYYLSGLILPLFLSDLWAIILSSVIFALYHLHMRKIFSDGILLSLIILFSFFIGLFLSTFLPYLGIFGCIIWHTAIVLSIYWRLSKISLKE